MPPLTMAAFRVGIAALILGCFVFIIKGRFVRDSKFWMHVAISGLFAQGLPFVLINWGEQYISSGLAAILNGLTPLFTIVLANFATKSDKINPYKLGGSILGFVGLCILLMPSLNNGFSGSTWGILAVVLAACSYGIALVYSKTFLQNAPPLTAPTGQLIMSTIYVLPLALIFEKPHVLSYALSSYVAIGFLAIMGTALAFIVYFTLLKRTNSSFVSQVTYLMPVFGVVLGTIFLNESLTSILIIGGSVILAGMALSNIKWNPRPKKMTDCQCLTAN